MLNVRKMSLAAALTAGLAASAVAAPIVDAPNDFLPTYTGAKNGDEDVLSAFAVYDGVAFHIGVTLAGPVGTTPASLYVIGFNRGTGTAGFAAIGLNNVLFDTVVTMTGAGVLGGRLLPEATAIAAASITKTISGNSFQIDIPASLLPSRGFTPQQYGINIWPRDTSQSGNGALADFAPDNATFVADLPEPISAALFATGLFGLGLIRRRAA